MFATILCAMALGCRPPDQTVTVHASLAETGALEGLDVIALPYDAQDILDSLAAAAETPRPVFGGLRDSLAAFRRRNPSEFAAISQDWAQVRARVQRLADSLTRVGRDAPGYRAAYARLRELYAGLVRQEVGLEDALHDLTTDDRDLALRAARAADSLRRWERDAFAAYDSLAAVATSASGRSVVATTTDASGTAVLRLHRGRWWLVAHAPDPRNPFAEFAWNVPISVTRLVPLVLPMTNVNVTLRWRH